MTEKESLPSPSKNAQKILVAEDNPVVRAGLTNFLTKWGYIPVEAEDGDTAIAIMEEDRSIQLAILDWNLPGLSGMQVCQRLHQRSDKPYVYSIIFTARKTDSEQVMALEGGADDYLSKPAKPSILRARLIVGQRIIEAIDGKKDKNKHSSTEEQS